MNLHKPLVLAGACALLWLASCNSDDSSGGDDYTPLVIETQPDSVEVLANQTVDIDIFANDNNIPTEGELSLSNPQNGVVEVLDNGTPANMSDDRIRYTPESTANGTDTFQYTVCNLSGEGCQTETVTINVFPVSPVNYDLDAMPYATLSEYNLFQGPLADQNPVYGVLPYEPITPLFSDYALKKRFIWMPDGSQANYVSDGALLDMPVGTILVKTFSYNNVQPAGNTLLLETRIMIKKETEWVFADYIWNEAQDQANFSLDGAFREVTWLQNGSEKFVNYRIPSQSECFTCHKSIDSNTPIGVRAQNLNGDYDFADGTKNQLQKWIEMGYLEDNLPSSINTVVAWDDPNEPLDLRVRSYLDINCASCHRDGGHCDYRSLRLAFEESGDSNNIGICMDPDTPVVGFEDPKVIDPGNPENSIMFFRMETINEEYRMPLIGRSLQHQEGVALIEEYINSLSQNCN